MIWEFPKLGVPYLIWGPYNKDPTIYGTILGSPNFGTAHLVAVVGPQGLGFRGLRFTGLGFRVLGHHDLPPELWTSTVFILAGAAAFCRSKCSCSMSDEGLLLCRFSCIALRAQLWQGCCFGVSQ